MWLIKGPRRESCSLLAHVRRSTTRWRPTLYPPLRAIVVGEGTDEANDPRWKGKFTFSLAEEIGGIFIPFVR